METTIWRHASNTTGRRHAEAMHHFSRWRLAPPVGTPMTHPHERLAQPFSLGVAGWRIWLRNGLDGAQPTSVGLARCCRLLLLVARASKCIASGQPAGAKQKSLARHCLPAHWRHGPSMLLSFHMQNPPSTPRPERAAENGPGQASWPVVM